MDEENLSLQEQEVEALSSIYGMDFHVEDRTNRTYSIEINEGKYSSNLQITMSKEYPTSGPPVYMIVAPWLKGPQRETLNDSLQQAYIDNTGESIVYIWVEKIREFMVEYQENEDNITEDNLEQQTNREICPKRDPPPEDFYCGPCPDIVSGGLITDRRSHFQPHLAVVNSMMDVKKVLSKLLENKKIAEATHNIYAYRFIPEDSQHYCEGSEDDGEHQAGNRLFHLLKILNVKNVLVIVTRWYGGIHLGPDRFKHINNAARQILLECGYIQSKQDKKSKNQRGRRK